MTLLSPPPVSAVLDGIPRRFIALRMLKRSAAVETVLAEDTLSGGAAVVIKRAPLGAVGSTVVARLQHEAEVLGHLGGVAGPVLLASGVENGYFWLAQRFAPGETLECRLRRGPMTVDDTLRMAGEVLAQLSQAHDIGVLHRDLKPANIMLGPQPGAGARS